MTFSNPLKLKFIALTFLFSIASKATAQSVGTITGLTKNQSNEVVIGATVILSKAKNGSIIKSAIMDNEGNFTFGNLKFDTCKLTINSVGVGKYTSESLIINQQNPIINIGSIVLSASTTELEAVSVTAKKSFVVQKLDRIVVTPDALISNAARLRIFV
jgi:iron complex outermembrane recepter protein